MPELAEVEYGRKLLERVAVGRKIRRCVCEDDRIVFDGALPEAFREALEGAEVRAARRHGKQLWLELDRKPWPLFHFGMTGAFRTPGDTPLELESKIVEAPGTWPPRFTKIELEMDDGGQLAMTNARRLGRIRLRDNPREEPPLSKLGFDPLDELPSEAVFVQSLGRRRSAVKAVLLDQSFAAGVGNWLADEILYQARIDPRRRAHELSPEERAAIRTHMGEVVRSAVEVDADKTRFPAHWLFHHRWGKKAGASVEGAPIQFDEVGGRTTAWVPSRQG